MRHREKANGSAQRLPPQGVHEQRFEGISVSGQLHVEKHYSVSELAGLWSLSERTIRRMFENEPGILCWGQSEGRHRRGYKTLRISRNRNAACSPTTANRRLKHFRTGWRRKKFPPIARLIVHSGLNAKMLFATIPCQFVAYSRSAGRSDKPLMCELFSYNKRTMDSAMGPFLAIVAILRINNLRAVNTPDSPIPAASTTINN